MHKPAPFVAVAIVLLLIALVICMGSEAFRYGGQGIAPNNLAGLTACGLAIAGGLALHAAAVLAAECKSSRAEQTLQAKKQK